jgi:predicted nucleic acid-binding protein
MRHLDSNVIVHALRGHPGVTTRLTALRPGQAGVSAVAAAEVRMGALRAGAPRRQRVEALLGSLEIISFDDAASRVAARIRFEL